MLLVMRDGGGWRMSPERMTASSAGVIAKYGVPPLDDDDVERIEAEWRGEAPKKRRRRAA
jgi:hypothetical protein